MNLSKYHIAICDDEVFWQEEILKYCKIAERQNHIQFIYHLFSSGEELLNFNGHLDILLLDEEMKQISGQMIKESFESADKDTMILFVTSHEEILYDSFGKNVYGFLHKPIESDKFLNLIQKIIKKKNKNQYITLPNSVTGKITIPCSDILYIKAKGSYTKFVLDNNQSLIIRRNISEIEKTLFYKNFFRVHKSYLVNFDHVQNLSANAAFITLKNEKEIPIARRRKKEIRNLFFKKVSERAEYLWGY